MTTKSFQSEYEEHTGHCWPEGRTEGYEDEVSGGWVLCQSVGVQPPTTTPDDLPRLVQPEEQTKED